MSWKTMWLEWEDALDCVAPDKIELPVGYVINVAAGGVLVEGRRYMVRLGCVIPEQVEAVKKTVGAYKGLELYVGRPYTKSEPMVYPQFMLADRKEHRKLPMLTDMVFVGMRVVDKIKAQKSIKDMGKLIMPVYCDWEEYVKDSPLYDSMTEQFVRYILYKR